ncbi:MAG: class I SAM-dependent methyltransferase [Anaerolineales bacterium]|nr:class I SAM-dependent methyltransferase [Anaerolineales bacterium]
MDNTNRFTTKAAVYAQHRWDFAPEAIDVMLEVSRVQAADWVADVGAGTGILTRHLVQRGLLTYAVEPNAAMRRIAEADFGGYPNFVSVAARSDATALDSHSIQLITVARALHWFPADATRTEFLRILKPAGWMAVLGVKCASDVMNTAIDEIRTVENGWDADHSRQALPPVSLPAYYGHGEFQDLRFPGEVSETWEQFCGRMLSFSPAPDPDNPRYPRYVDAAHTIFRHFAEGDTIYTPIATEVSIGQMR